MIGSVTEDSGKSSTQQLRISKKKSGPRPGNFKKRSTPPPAPFTKGEGSPPTFPAPPSLFFPGPRPLPTPPLQRGGTTPHNSSTKRCALHGTSGVTGGDPTPPAPMVGGCPLVHEGRGTHPLPGPGGYPHPPQYFLPEPDPPPGSHKNGEGWASYAKAEGNPSYHLTPPRYHTSKAGLAD